MLFFLLSSLKVWGVELIFTSPAQQQAFEMFVKEFRCVTCPNQSIMDSAAPVAQAMKEEIYHRWQQGESPAAIRSFLLAQYGDYVLYRPLMKKSTLPLWLGPFGLLMIGFIIWLKIFCRTPVMPDQVKKEIIP